MTAISVSAPFPVLTDIDGDPLDAGYVYIGQANLDPVAFPKSAYWDASLTTPAAQPIRTSGGYPVRNGSPARIYTDGDYSIRINNKNGTLVYSSPAATERMDSEFVGYDGGTVQDVLDGAKSLQDYDSLRAYTGRATRIYITGLLVTVKPSGIAGVFQYDPTDTTSADNGGTIIVGADGRGWKRDYSGEVSIAWFGVSTSASAAENTAAIQAAANHCTATGEFLKGVPGTYLVNNTITLKCSGDLSPMTLSAPGASISGPVILVGETGGTYTSRLDLTLPEVVNSSKTGTDWTGAGSFSGVDIANVYHSKISLNYVFGFVVGWDIGGHGFGNGLNTYHCIGYAHNNKVNIRLQPKSGTGWVNDNLFLGVGARIDSNHAGVSGTRNIQLIPFDINVITHSWPNNNVFVKPAIEGDAPEYHLEIAGNDNLVVSPRLETTGAITQKVLLSSHPTETKTIRNLIQSGYSSTKYTFTEIGACAANGVASPSFNVFDSITSKPIFAIKSTNSASNAHLRGYPTTSSILNAADTDTGWVYQLTGSAAEFKSSAAADPIIRIAHNGFLYLDSGAAAPTKYLTGTSSGIRTSAAFYPSADNTLTLGAATLRWSTIYAATGTINTSDSREKQQVRDLSDAERAVAIRLKGMLRAFKFNDAVQAKGDAARIHFGVIAQEVIEAFNAAGLDPMRYAIVCYDEWEAEPAKLDDDGNLISPEIKAGNRYGIRYDELLAFIIAAL